MYAFLFLILFSAFYLHFVFAVTVVVIVYFFYVFLFLLKIVDIMFHASASRDIKQFQYTTWPENDSPDSGIGIIELIGQVQKWSNSINNKTVTVHCR